jgi:hypothetical protein
MPRQAVLVLLATAVLAPAGTAGRYSPAAAPSPRAPAQRVVVRTELVPASSDGFDWLDAAAGFGVAIVAVAVVLLAVGGNRQRLPRPIRL